jgi:filamin
LSIQIDGPSEVAINKCMDNGDATCSVAYLPTVPGEYIINITFNNEHIIGSPFVVKIKPDPLRQIIVSGKGIQPDGILSC